MLPFMAKKTRNSDSGGISTTFKTTDAKPEDSSDEGIDSSALKAAAQDILRAISQNDHLHLAEALSSFLAIKDSMPEEDDSSDEQDSE